MDPLLRHVLIEEALDDSDEVSCVLVLLPQDSQIFRFNRLEILSVQVLILFAFQTSSLLSE